MDYVFAKVERAAWGWTHEQSLRHARWVAQLSLEHPRILGIYLNDFYDEIEEGHRTGEQWREIIAAIRSTNPRLQIWAPHGRPHRLIGASPAPLPTQGTRTRATGSRSSRQSP